MVTVSASRSDTVLSHLGAVGAHVVTDTSTVAETRVPGAVPRPRRCRPDQAPDVGSFPSGFRGHAGPGVECRIGSPTDHYLLSALELGLS